LLAHSHPDEAIRTALDALFDLCPRLILATHLDARDPSIASLALLIVVVYLGAMFADPVAIWFALEWRLGVWARGWELVTIRINRIGRNFASGLFTGR